MTHLDGLDSYANDPITPIDNIAFPSMKDIAAVAQHGKTGRLPGCIHEPDESQRDRRRPRRTRRRRRYGHWGRGNRTPTRFARVAHTGCEPEGVAAAVDGRRRGRLQRVQANFRDASRRRRVDGPLRGSRHLFRGYAGSGSAAAGENLRPLEPQDARQHDEKRGQERELSPVSCHGGCWENTWTTGGSGSAETPHRPLR
jgi:hypothetical protein